MKRITLCFRKKGISIFLLIALFSVFAGCSGPLSGTGSPEEYQQFKKALEKNNISSIHELLKKNPSFVRSYHTDGFTPLFIVVLHGTLTRNPRIEIMKLLVDDYNADVNTRCKQSCDQAPLHEAADETLQSVKFLLEKGADIHAKDCEGATTLHYAVRHKATDIVSFLIEKGADVNIKKKNGELPIDEISWYYKHKRIIADKMIRILEKAGSPEFKSQQ